MKSNKEIVDNLLQRKEQYEAEKRNKKIKLTRTLTPICCACLVALIGLGVFYKVPYSSNISVENSDSQHGNISKDYLNNGKEKLTDSSNIPTGKSVNQQETSLKELFYNNFTSTVDPNADAYGEEELPCVSIVISGNYYYQLDSSEHPAYNISPVIKKSDFGEHIGKITELFEYDDPLKYPVSSKEPNLSGADVYYYAPSDSFAVTIVKKGQQCSIFVFNGMSSVSDGSSVFADTFKLYGADSAEDIDNISFSISTLNGSAIEISTRGTITDREKISTVTNVLFQLKPEVITNSLSVTPEWLNKAWNEYRANPDAFIREDIMFDITFKNGTVLKDISYQPYLGNGYIACMQELTSEENVKLRQVFK